MWLAVEPLDMRAGTEAALVSRIGVMEPGMIGVMEPVFEGENGHPGGGQECVVFDVLATFSLLVDGGSFGARYD